MHNSSRQPSTAPLRSENPSKQRSQYWSTVLNAPASQPSSYSSPFENGGHSSPTSSATLSPTPVNPNYYQLPIPALFPTLSPVANAADRRDGMRARYPCKSLGCRQTFAHRSSRSRHYSKFHKGG